MPTSYEIYQTYLRGPAAVIRLFEEALGTRAVYGPPDPGMQQRTIDALSEQVEQLKAQVGTLRAVVSDLRGREFKPLRRNAEFEALILNDLHNSLP